MIKLSGSCSIKYQSLLSAIVLLFMQSTLSAQDSFAQMGVNAQSGTTIQAASKPQAGGGMLSAPATQTPAPQAIQPQTALNNEVVTPPSNNSGLNGQYANVFKMETQDFGVAPKSELHAGPMHGPTPASIPGAKLITTEELISLLQSSAGQVAVFDVLGAAQGLPNAIPLVPASQPGHFNDQTQQQLKHYLSQLTQGRQNVPMVFYCQGVQCWMSYNAALRASKLGYTALWYRGGVEAWSMAGQQLQTMMR